MFLGCVNAKKKYIYIYIYSENMIEDMIRKVFRILYYINNNTTQVITNYTAPAHQFASFSKGVILESAFTCLMLNRFVYPIQE